MKNKLLFVLIGLVIFSAAVYAASTATPAIFGYVSTTGCPTGQSSCFLPFTSANPFPVVAVSP